jgi:hypothetical protein
MTKIAIQPAATGTGTVTLTAPAINNNISFAFPSTAGTLITAEAIPQLTQAEAQNPSSTVFGTVSGQRLGQSLTSAFSGAAGAPRVKGSARSLNLIGTATVSSAVSSVTITDLPPHFGLVVEGVGITLSASNDMQVLVSGDNGSSFSAGVFIFGNFSAGTNRRLGGVIHAWPNGAVGVAGYKSAGFPSTASTLGQSHSLPNGINAIRWTVSSGNMSAGTFNIYADIREYE